MLVKQKSFIIGKVEGCSGSVIQNFGCDQEGRLSWEIRVEEVGFEVFPKRCDSGTVSYLEGERVPKNWGIVTEGIREVFDSSVNSTVESGGMKKPEFGGASPCISGSGVGVN